jgi:hypothetical protein
MLSAVPPVTLVLRRLVPSPTAWSLAAGAWSLTACVTTLGSDFNTRQLQSLEPGAADKSRVQAVLGNTREHDRITIKTDAIGRPLPQPVSAEKLDYYYLDRSAPAAPGLEKEPRRLASLLFRGDRLISYWSSSTFAADSTDFDAQRVQQLRRRLSTQADVLALFGPPSGRAIHPAALDENGTRWIYRVQWTADHQLHIKTLAVDFDASHIVLDFAFESTTG